MHIRASFSVKKNRFLRGNFFLKKSFHTTGINAGLHCYIISNLFLTIASGEQEGLLCLYTKHLMILLLFDFIGRTSIRRIELVQ